MKTIRELRGAKGMTQLQVANALGVTPSTVYSWERGDKEPRVGHLRKLAELFAVRMDDIELVEGGVKAAA